MEELWNLILAGFFVVLPGRCGRVVVLLCRRVVVFMVRVGLGGVCV